MGARHAAVELLVTDAEDRAGNCWNGAWPSSFAIVTQEPTSEIDRAGCGTAPWVLLLQQSHVRLTDSSDSLPRAMSEVNISPHIKTVSQE